jgi:glycosyltransferase involved in cell wall biosynthesis
VAILSKYNMAIKYAAALNRCAPNCAVILDTVDLHHVREERQAKIAGDAAALAQARLTRVAEMRCACLADQVWAVTPTEASVLRTTGTPVRVIPVIHTPETGAPGFADRRGIAFLGRYVHAPNVDAVRFYMDAVHPLVSGRLPEAGLTLAGSDPPEEIRSYSRSDARVTVPGYVADHRALLKAHRVGVAPLRFGAGMKGKIGESMACGLPCVTTSIGAEGLGIESGREAFVADGPREFAEAVVRLYRDAGLWERMSREGVAFVGRRFSRQVVATLVIEAVESVRPRSRVSRLKRRVWTWARRALLRRPH